MNNLRVLFLLIPSFLLFGCDSENPTGILNGKITEHSECLLKNVENTQVSSSQSCISFTYSNQTLFITHFNAGFNCCPGTLSASFSLLNDTLSIYENESQALCDCNCLYDLEMEANQLNAGFYVVRFVEPYVSIPSEELIFNINLNDSTTGTFCVDRNQYPWNL